MDAALGYANTFGRNFLSQSKRGCQIDLERLQVAAVDADQVASGIQRALQLIFVVNFAEHVKLVCCSGMRKREQVFLFEGRNDEQNRIGAMGAGFDDLKFIDYEILAQAGKGSCRRRLLQISKRALKKFFIRQHGKGCGACPLQFLRQLGWTKIRADQAF